MAENLVADAPAYSPGLVAYNISLNLSSIFNFPGRLFSRFRKPGDVQATESILLVTESTAWFPAPTPPPIQKVPLQMFPGPWAFFTSGYMLGLLIMGVVMHRLPNIIVPPRINRHPRRNGLAEIYRALLPLDMTKTTTRMAMHLPTSYLMCRALVLWTLVLLQTSDLFPEHSSGPIHYLGKWSETKDMQEISWSTFCAVCAAFCVEALARGLDGVGFGFGAHMHANTSPFNLVGYAFLLHIYSSSITHVFKPEGLPSRPDKHVVVTITIPLLQLTILHILSIHKRWSRHRLLPTALSSFLSLLHFHLTLFSRWSPANFFHSSARTGPYSAAGTSSYPLLNYIPSLFETILLLTTALTILLNVITQLLVSGEVTKPLLGLGLTGPDGHVAGWSWTPPWEEDFGILLLRVGTASLEATGLRGWGNEVGGIVASLPDHGSLRMDRTGAVRVSAAKKKKGWKNEVKQVDVGGGGDSDVWGIPRVFTLDMRRAKAAWKLFSGFWNVVLGLVSIAWRRVVLRQAAKSAAPQDGELNEAAGYEDVGPAEDNEDEDDLVYDKFLRGEAVSDDEGDWVTESDSSETDEEQESVGGDVAGLYSDLQCRGDNGDVTPSTILAHMANGQGSPLTRRRYQSILGEGSSLGRTDSPPQSAPRHASENGARADGDDRRNCVVCMCEPREIICWPCRCLTMCDLCRENLANQVIPSKHRCPCCRKLVEGYSRIYIP